jgi:hypothetical protein
MWLTNWSGLVYLWREKPSYDLMDGNLRLGLKDHNTKKQIGTIGSSPKIISLLGGSIVPLHDLELVELEVEQTPVSVTIRRKEGR